MKTSAEIIDSYLDDKDWRVKENSNNIKTIGGLGKYAIGEVGKDYWLRSVYNPVNEEIAQSHIEGYIHIHDLSGVPTLYCCGYSLKDILDKGVHGPSNIASAGPAHHFMSALNQLVNLTSVFQNEIMGAVAFSNVDTLLAPYIKRDNLDYKSVKQCLQNYIFSINSNSRAGAEPAFTNITLDLTPDKGMLHKRVVIAGEDQGYTYKECQPEIDMFNRAFCEIMIAGDGDGKSFAYPIPTYNITERFDWDNPNNELLWEMTGKYGYPYFTNYINSDLNPEDARSMCPLLGDTLLDIKESPESDIKTVTISSLVGKEVYVKYEDVWKLARCNHVEEQLLVSVKDKGHTHTFGENHLQPIVRNDNLDIVHAGELRIGDYLIYNKGSRKDLYRIEDVRVTSLSDDLYCMEVL